MRRRLVCRLLLITGFLGLGSPPEIFAKEKVFPSKPVELVCPWGAGGSTSMGGRIIAGTLAEFLGVPVVVMHKTGGGGSVAAAHVARSKPDGYTLLIFNSASNGVMPATRTVEYKNTDFEVLGLYGTQPLALWVKREAPWRSLQELISDAKKEPGKLKYATPGLGTSSHFSMELFKMAVGGLKMDAVHFKSGPEMVAALLGGHVQMCSLYLTDMKGVLEAGKVRMVAVMTEKRWEDYPNVPTFADLGYPEVKMTSWYGIAAPAAVPKEVSEKLKAALEKTIKHPDVRKMLVHIGYTPTYKDAQEFSKFVSEEERKFQRIAKEGNIRID